MKKKFQTGLTLLEIMIAAALLTVGVMALLISLASSTSSVSLTKNLSEANKAASLAIETLKSYKDYENLYNQYKGYTNTGAANKGPFFVMEGGKIDWDNSTNTPTNPTAGAIGYGWFEFITNEGIYKSIEWGTGTVWSTGGPGDIDGDGVSDGVDLDGDGLADNTSVILGRDRNSPPPPPYGRYNILPVKVTVRIYTQGKDELELVRRVLVLNNYEK